MPKGDPNVGNKKSGYLNKRSEGRLRNVWQKRRCQAQEGFLEIYHADETKPPTRVNLLTCQMKPVSDERLCFDVVSYNRTYHFQAENDTDREEWMSVLLNSKDRALNQAFQVNIFLNLFIGNEILEKPSISTKISAFLKNFFLLLWKNCQDAMVTF